ncbi:MAG: LacI family DNA-binding transcriptional regulator [Armatimonadota bacterium]
MAVTIKDVAKACAVSVSTVSNILGNKPNSFIGEKTRNRVKEMAVQMGYRPHYAARMLRSGSNRTVGLMLPDILNPHFAEHARLLEEAVSKRGYSLLVMDSALKSENEVRSMEEMLEQRCDGVIAFLTNFEPVKHLFPQFVKDRIPCVIMGLPMDTSALVDGVRGDGSHALDMAIEHLLDLGHTEIAMLGSYPHSFRHECVSEDFKSCLQRHGLEWSDNRLLIRSTGDQLADGYAIVDEFLQKYPTATAALGVNDMFIIGVIRRLAELHISVPGDISLIGTDNTWLAKSFPVPLTSMDPNTPRFVEVAADMLFSRLADNDWGSPMREVVEYSLKVRQSTGPVRPYSSLTSMLKSGEERAVYLGSGVDGSASEK